MGGNRNYDMETKLAAVTDHVDHGMKLTEVVVKYGLSSRSLLVRWCREYRVGGADALKPKKRGRPRKADSAPEPTPTREQELEAEVRYLRAQVAYLGKVRALRASRSATAINPR